MFLLNVLEERIALDTRLTEVGVSLEDIEVELPLRVRSDLFGLQPAGVLDWAGLLNSNTLFYFEVSRLLPKTRL